LRRVLSLAILAAVFMSLIAPVFVGGAGRPLGASDEDPAAFSEPPVASVEPPAALTYREMGAVGPLEWPGELLLQGVSFDALSELTSPTPLLGLAWWNASAVGPSGDPLSDGDFLSAGDPRGHEPPGQDGGHQTEEDQALPKVIIYTVKSGDTVWDIAQEFGVSVETIMGASGLSNASRIQVGQVLKILTINGVLHEVEPGDTVAALAAKYKVDPDDIARANAMTDPPNLTPGQELIIPGARPVIVHKVTVGNRQVTLYGKYLWPVTGTITSRFGWRWGRFHHGIDIGAPQGRSIVASRAGRVTFSGWNGGYGNTVIIDHGDGVTTLYAHASRLLVSRGTWVEAGQVIARVGSTGFSTGPHLHFEVRVNGVAINPLSVLE